MGQSQEMGKERQGWDSILGVERRKETVVKTELQVIHV